MIMILEIKSGRPFVHVTKIELLLVQNYDRIG